MPFRYHRRTSLGRRLWIGFSRSGPSFGRRGRRLSWSLNRRGPGLSVRLGRGLSWFKRW